MFRLSIPAIPAIPAIPVLVAASIAAIGILSAASAHAHGAPEAQHGGIVSVANDLGYELVATPEGASIYVTDHDDAVDARALAGKLTVLNGSAKAEAPLVYAGGNRLDAKGVKLARGARVVAVFDGAGRKVTTVRFVLR